MREREITLDRKALLETFQPMRHTRIRPTLTQGMPRKVELTNRVCLTRMAITQPRAIISNSRKGWRPSRISNTKTYNGSRKWNISKPLRTLGAKRRSSRRNNVTRSRSNIQNNNTAISRMQLCRRMPTNSILHIRHNPISSSTQTRSSIRCNRSMKRNSRRLARSGRANQRRQSHNARCG